MASRRADKTNDPRSALWATLTIIALPIVAISLQWFGFDPLFSFMSGVLASVLILLLEGALRGRWWIMEPSVQKILEQPELPMRLLVFVGIVLLVFETFVLVSFLTHRSLDRGIVSYVLSRECAAPKDSFFSKLCRTDLTPSQRSVNAVNLALREEAAKRLFSNGGLVTCATIELAKDVQPETCTHGSVIRCDRWHTGTLAGHPISLESKTSVVMAELGIQEDGTYRVLQWSDNPIETSFISIGGDIAQQAIDTLDQYQRSHDIESILRKESFRRVMEELSSN